MINIHFLVAALFAPLAILNTTNVDPRKENAPIVLEISEPERGDTFSCRIPVHVKNAGSVKLEYLSVIAKAYRDGIALSSTGINTSGPTLIPRFEGNVRSYVSVPIQFALTRGDCERMDSIHVIFARCTFLSRKTSDCLSRLHFEPKVIGGIHFHIGAPNR